MEIRKCVYLSEFFVLLEELNTLESWRKLIGKKKLDKRLRDMELILRIIALRDRVDKYEKPMKKFLNDYMSDKKKVRPSELEKLIDTTNQEFENVCGYVLEQLGERPFHIRGRLNYAVMDSTMSCAFDAVKANVIDFKDRFEQLLKDESYFESVTKNASIEKTVELRFKKAREYLLA